MRRSSEENEGSAGSFVTQWKAVRSELTELRAEVAQLQAEVGQGQMQIQSSVQEIRNDVLSALVQRAPRKTTRPQAKPELAADPGDTVAEGPPSPSANEGPTPWEDEPLLTPEEIKRTRLKLGLSQKDAAERVRITPAAWSYLENGKNVPSRQTALLIRLLEQEII